MFPEFFSPELKESLTRPTDGSSEKVSIVTIIPDEAHEIVNNMGYERQRGINHAHVGMIADSMSNDAFVRCRLITFSPDESGDIILVDGQHRLNAAINAQWTGLWIICCLWDPKDHAELDYIRLDTSQKERNAPVIGKAIHTYEHLANRLQSSLFGSARYMCSWSSEYNLPPHATIPPFRHCQEMIDSRITAYETLDEIIKSTEVRAHIKPKLTSPQILAVIAETIHQMPDEAEGFWKSVAASGQGIAADLHSLLLTGKPQGSSAYYMARLAAHAWNQRASNRTLRRNPRITLKLSRTPLIVPR